MTPSSSFLQRFAGYCLTGITREHAMSFGYGTGANGKGTFLNTISGLLGGLSRQWRRSRRSPPARPIGIRPSLPCCAARDW